VSVREREEVQEVLRGDVIRRDPRQGQAQA
jgi:hypothetical protein